ncbi:MAG: Rid family detoxifying hydrolase [Spirosomataceae bacterium]
MEVILTPDAPTPRGHYSQAIVHNGLVYVSGILPIDISGNKLTHDSLETQTAQVLSNLNAILKAAGSEPAKVLKTTVYITDVNHWGRVNTMYAAFFGEHRPARSIVPIKELHFGLQIELEAIASL